MTCKSEKRVKNEDAGTLINKNVISPPPTPPHPPPTPPRNPGMPTRNYHRKRVTKHSKKRRKCNGAQENSVKRGMKWMLRKWRKHEKTTTLRDALAGSLPKTNTVRYIHIDNLHTNLFNTFGNGHGGGPPSELVNRIGEAGWVHRGLQFLWPRNYLVGPYIVSQTCRPKFLKPMFWGLRNASFHGDVRDETLGYPQIFGWSILKTTTTSQASDQTWPGKIPHFVRCFPHL